MLCIGDRGELFKEKDPRLCYRSAICCSSFTTQALGLFLTVSLFKLLGFCSAAPPARDIHALFTHFPSVFAQKLF